MNSQGPIRGERHFSVEDVMELYGVSKSYVYKMACANQWRRMRVFGGKVVYYWADVDSALGKDPFDS